MPVSGCPPLMTSKHQRLQRQNDRLQAKDHRVHERHGVDDVQIDPLKRADIIRRKQCMVA